MWQQLRQHHAEIPARLEAQRTRTSLASLEPPAQVEQHKPSSRDIRVAQVRVVFQLPSKIIRQVILSSEVTLPMHLAYVEWFSPIPTTPESNSLLYKVSRLTQDSRNLASIIPINTILCSVHLFPRFRQDTLTWNTFSVLELCPSFYINPFSSRDVFLLFL